MRGRFEGFEAVFLYCPLRARLTKCPMNNSIISFLSFFKWICCLFLLFSAVFLPCLKILMYSVMKLHRLSGPDRGMKGISNKTRMFYSCERLFWYITFRLYWLVFLGLLSQSKCLKLYFILRIGKALIRFALYMLMLFLVGFAR